MTMPGDDGTSGVGSYIPAGTVPKTVPNSPVVPLQTTFPTEVPAGVLPGLAATAGTGHNEGSSGIMSALLSADSEGVGLEGEPLGVENDTTWPAGVRPMHGATKASPYENGNVSSSVTSGQVVGGKPPLGPKAKDFAKVTATHSEPHLPATFGEVGHHREPLPFPVRKPHLNFKEGSEHKPREEVKVLQSTQSLPVWMPSTVSSADAPESIAEEVAAIKTPPLTPRAIEDANNSLFETPTPTPGATPGATPVKDQLPRATTMPAANYPEQMHLEKNLARTSTAKRRMQKNLDNANVRVVAEAKMSDRKKKRLMREFANIQTDGGVDIDLARSGRLAKDLFGPNVMDETDSEIPDDEQPWEDEEEESDQKILPSLKIVMLIVGTRGDVQPFVAIGKKLQECGHQVRLATHANFRDFVKKEGLEFYPLGGDPKVLAEYMVKNKGFLPSGPSEISIQRKQIKSIVYSLLDACIKPDKDTGVPFRPNAIIANPPAYGHVHVAEYLKVPLHIFFTMPWTATSAFPHPLARVKQSAGNRLSYQVVDSLIWLGIRGIINSFRKKYLKLRPITYLSGSQGSISDLPTGYIWSPHLVPKPRDWGPLVDVVGFCFLNLASNYKPPEALERFLNAGPPPIYIGFGSLPVEDPKGMTKVIVDALNKTGQRGIIGRGWGGIGDLPEVPENIYLVSDCPHDWLFPRCAAVVHHGGAGTTAAGLKAACPTTVVPFFGDQPFWGARVQEKGVGPAPIPVKHFDLEKLVSAIEFMLDPAVKEAALELAKGMEKEDGIQGAVNAFHKHLRSHKNFANLLDAPPLEELNHNRHHGLMFRIKRKCKSLLHH
jgi:sterol 3beta-glucosyltransferase